MVDMQSAMAENRRGRKEEERTRMWADAQRDAAQLNIGGARCEYSVIPYLVPCRNVWLTPLLECRAVTLPM